MANNEVSKPSRYNYHNSNAYDFANAYNGDSDGMHFSASQGIVIYDGCGFSDINSSSIIVGYKLSSECRTFSAYTGSTSYVRFRLVTDYYNGSTTSSSNNGYTSIGGEHTIYSQSGADTTYRTSEYSNMDTSSTEVQWLNSNIDKVLGGTAFGFRMTGQRAYLRKLTLTLYYINSAMFVGGNGVSSVYVGGTKAKAVYIGSTKIL